ncbi:MAG: hypothetical protein IKK70_06700 [Clostridia bacterium]|nr:hypothetical protein [Clostridia bacterium]
MKVKCIEGQLYPEPLVLPFKQSETIHENNYMSIVYSQDIVGTFVIPRQIYDVYGILIYGKNAYYLIDNQQDSIRFLPATLFTIVSNSFNGDWRIFDYKLFDGRMIAIGPSVFVGNYKNIRDIIKETKEMMLIFLKYKLYYKEWGVSPFE